MTAITTNASGNWSSTSTWTGGVIPGNGDTVTLNHSVTVDSARTVGSSPASGGTPAIAWGTANVVLTINADLTLRGDIIPLYSSGGSDLDLIVQAAGVTVTFDSSAASSPSTTNYACRLNGFSQYWHWKFNGTSASKCTLQSNASGGNGYFDTNGGTGEFSIDATYTKFLRIGDATRNFVSPNLTAGFSPKLVMDHCVIDACGFIDAFNAPDGVGKTLNLSYSVFKNSVGSNNIRIGDAAVAATCTVDNCYFDLPLYLLSGSNGTFTNNVYVQGQLDTGGGTAAAAFSDSLLCWGPGNISHARANPNARMYYLNLDSAESNPHGPSFSDGFACGFTDSVFEGSYPTMGGGDFVFTPAPASAISYTLTGNILLPLADGKSPGKFLSCLTIGGLGLITVNHNTIVSDGAAGGEIGVVQYGETGGGAAGEIASLKSNLAWSATSGNAVILSRLAGTLQGEVSASNADYNATWNGKTGTDGVGYVSQSAGSMFASGTPGVHDVTVSSDPFVDKTRRFRTWSASLGAASTNAAGLALMLDRLDWTSGTYNASNGATPSALVTWVRAGFIVNAAVLNNAGHDGVTIGAMPYQALTDPMLFGAMCL